MPGERVEGAGAVPVEDAERAQRLAAQRLREAVAASAPGPRDELMTRYDLERWRRGDAGHLQRAADLRAAPLASHRGLLGRPVVALKRTLRRLLHPLLDIQSDLNAADARVVAYLLEQLAAQAEAIDELAREVAELRAEREP
jgi:hypothetical protein